MFCFWERFFSLTFPQKKISLSDQNEHKSLPPFSFYLYICIKETLLTKSYQQLWQNLHFHRRDYWLLDVTFKDCWNVQVKARKQRVRLADWSWKGFDCLTEPPPALSTLYHSWLLTMYVTQWCASLVTTATILLPPKSPGFGSATRVSTTLCSCKHMQLLGKDGVSKTDEFSEKFPNGGGSFPIQKFMLQILDLK